VRDKIKLTKELINHLPPDKNMNFDDVYAYWWCNLRSSGGMRLTSAGYNAFKNTFNLDDYGIPTGVINNATAFIMLCDKRIQHPYYLIMDKKTITEIKFFSQYEAAMATLHGDVQKFLSMYK
jgi:hypothetical protein